jgi:hypothetical protein
VDFLLVEQNINTPYQEDNLNTGNSGDIYTLNKTTWAKTNVIWQLQCCAVDIQGNSNCVQGPTLYPTSDCGSYFYSLQFARYVTCLYETAFGGGVN